MEPGLNNLPAQSRLWCTLFLIVVLLGMVAAIGQHVLVSGLNSEATAAYYRGGETVEAIYVEKPLQDMFRVAHTHLFGLGLLISVLCRILAMAPISERAKMAGYAAAFGSLIFQVCAPWLVRFGGASFAPLVGLSVGALSLSIVSIVFISLYFIWFFSSSKAK